MGWGSLLFQDARLSYTDSLPKGGGVITARPERRLLLVCSGFLAASLLWAVSPGWAQTAGRVQITVLDIGEQPIEGAAVVLELIGDRELKLESKTDKRGRVLFAIQDATYSFDVSISAAGFHPITSQIKPKVREVARSKFVLEPVDAGGSAPADESAPSGVSYTPAESVHNQGVNALRSGDPASALAKFQQALELDATLSVARSALAGLYLQQKDYARAIAEAKQLLVLEPKSLRANRILYDAGQATGDTKLVKRAEKELQAAGGLGTDPAVKYNQGAEAFAVGDLTTARARFEEALALDSTLLAALSGLTMVEASEGNHQQAVELAERILELDPSNLRALRARYNAAIALGDETTIHAAFEALARQDPEAMIGQLFEQAMTKFNQNQLDEARTDLERLLEIAPDHPPAHYYLGLCSVNLGAEEKAREYFLRFLELDPNSENAAVAREMLEHLQ